MSRTEDAARVADRRLQPTRCAIRSRIVRALWIAAIILIIIGLGAWSTTCTGPRPRPTGETIPPGDVATTTVPPTESSLAG
jgi:hypothetical protein